jgi:hypothetical protein
MKQSNTTEQYFVKKLKGLAQKIVEKTVWNKKHKNQPDKQKSVKMDLVTYNFCSKCLYNLENNPEFPTKWEFKDLNGRDIVFTLTEATQLLNQSTSPEAFISNLKSLYGDGKGQTDTTEFKTSNPELQGRNQRQTIGIIETYPGIEPVIRTLHALLLA